MTDVPRIESVFSKAEIAEMRARFAEEAAARAAQVTTEASRTLLARSRTVIDKDRYVLTVVDGDVLDLAKAIEAEAHATAGSTLSGSAPVKPGTWPLQKVSSGSEASGREAPESPDRTPALIAATVIGTNLVIDYGSEEGAREALGAWPGLDRAWREAEAAAPERWRLRVTRTDDDFDVWQASAVSPAFFDGENDNDSDFAHGEGPTPEAALRALAAALLPTQASDSPEKPDAT